MDRIAKVLIQPIYRDAIQNPNQDIPKILIRQRSVYCSRCFSIKKKKKFGFWVEIYWFVSVTEVCQNVHYRMQNMLGGWHLTQKIFLVSINVKI